MKGTMSVAIVFSFFMAVASFASAQEEGLIPRLFKKFTQKEKKIAPVTKKEIPAPAVQQVREKAPAPQPAPTTVMEKKEMTKDEIVKLIESELEGETEIFDNIPGLKKNTGEGGKIFYTYRIDSKDMKLADIDKAILSGLLNKIYNQATILRTDRITGNLETIRRNQELLRSVPQPPPQPVSAISQPPKTPSQPPRAPSAPPSPPRR